MSKYWKERREREEAEKEDSQKDQSALCIKSE